MDVLAVSDPAAGVGLVAALFAGMVSFLSPCVLPLVPGYLSAVSGVSVDELEDAGWRRVLLPSLCFVASFSLIFILLGLTATKLGSILSDNRQLLDKIAAALIIAMGVLFVASFFVVKLNREWHVDALMSRAGKGGPVVAGAAFAFAWTPCIGPTLGAILSAASLSGSAAKGALLLAVYPVQVLRLWPRLGLERALFLTLGKLPEALGVVQFWLNRLLHRRAALIEYK